jgi:hypothetical protein
VDPDLRRVPLVGDYERFLPDLQEWFERPSAGGLNNPFLTFVAMPMFEAWQMHKAKDYRAAIETAELIRAEDWKIACVEWLQRRQARLQEVR